MITLSIISEGSELKRICRDALEELGLAWKLVWTEDFNSVQEGDICLWDYSVTCAPPSDPPSCSLGAFYLVSPAHLQEFQQRFPWAEGQIVLKPVSRIVLKSFLSSAAALHAARPSDDLSQMRAERDNILQCLLQANLKLQESDHQRTAFLARIVHDLRSPLTAVNGFCGLLLSGRLGDLKREQISTVERMQRSVSKMSRMTAALLDLSVNSRVPDSLEGESDDICDCIKQTVAQMVPAAEERYVGLTITHLVPPDANLAFDRCQVEQVLVNLLENAIRFTPRLGYVTVSGYPCFWDRRLLSSGNSQAKRRTGICKDANAYRVDVFDSGPEVSAENASTIFEEYTTYSGGAHRSGSGIALAICKWIVNRHHGKIWVEPGKGAKFSFTLPYPPVARIGTACNDSLESGHNVSRN